MRGANTLLAVTCRSASATSARRPCASRRSGVFDQNSLFLALGYGLTERLQLSLQVPYTWYEADKSDFNGSGIDDLSFGLGYRFLDEAGWRPALSVVGYAVAPTAERMKDSGPTSGAPASHSPPARRSSGRSARSPARATSTTAAGRRPGRGPVRLGAGGRVRDHSARLGRRRGHSQHQLAAGRRPALRLDRRDERGRAPPVRRLPDQPGRAQGLHQRCAGLGRVRARHLPDEVGSRSSSRAAAGRAPAGQARGLGRPPERGSRAGRTGAGPAPGRRGAGGPGAGAPAPGARCRRPGAGGRRRRAPVLRRRAPRRQGRLRARAAPGAPAPGAPVPGPAPGRPVPGPGGVAAVPPAALPPSLRSALRDINFEFDRTP